MRIAPDKQHSRKAAAAAQPPNGVLRRPEAKTDALVIEVAFDGKSHMDAFVPEGYPNFSWVALSGQDNIIL